MGLRKLPLLPALPTMHLMARAAVAVYEAAVENAESRSTYHTEVILEKFR